MQLHLPCKLLLLEESKIFWRYKNIYETQCNSCKNYFRKCMKTTILTPVERASRRLNSKHKSLPSAEDVQNISFSISFSLESLPLHKSLQSAEDVQNLCLSISNPYPSPPSPAPPCVCARAVASCKTGGEIFILPSDLPLATDS